jgi:hypothetical protein
MGGQTDILIDGKDASPVGSSGSPLPPNTRSRMEAVFDHDFEHVRIHTEDRAAMAAADRKAHAITVGHDISFGANEFAPHTPKRRSTACTRAYHIIQHEEGRMPSSGMLSPTHELEKETYATEQRIAAKLPSIDEHIGTRREPTGAWSQYRGEPTLARSIDERSTGDAEPRGPNTTDAALMGPLPSAEEARSEEQRRKDTLR